MVKYLKNNICEFEVLFDINYNKKVNILSTCFFKMKKHYKNFNVYLKGINNLIKIVEQQQKYMLRIFIDENIKNDKEIFNILNSSKHVQLVVFSCAKYMKDNYHLDVFGALVRLFPVFNFENNDSGNVIIIDIDLGKEDLETLKTIMNYDTDKEQIVGKGRAEDLIIRKIYPHYYLNLCGFYNKKYSSEIITDFITNAHKIDDKGLYNVRNSTFGFGTDELFLNNYFIYKKGVTTNIELAIIFDYDINWFLYGYKKDLIETKPLITNKNLTFILENFKKQNSSLEDMFNTIDSLVYKINYKDPKKIFITKKYYMLIEQLLNKNNEWFDIKIMKLINKYYKNIIQCTSIVFFNHDLDIIQVKNLSVKKI